MLFICLLCVCVFGRFRIPYEIDIPKFERLNRLNIYVFELNGTVLTSVYINKNYSQPQIDLLLFENHYCQITKLHCSIIIIHAIIMYVEDV